jgi:hypothetical protein
LLLATPAVMAAKPVAPVCTITGASFPNPADDASSESSCIAGNVCVYVGGTLEYEGTVTGGTAPYATEWQFGGGNPFQTSGIITNSGGMDTQSAAYNTEGSYSTDFSARDSSGRNGTACSADSQNVQVINPTGGGGTGDGEKSINSTSANGPEQATQVSEVPFDATQGFTTIAINDLGMHCADLDSRVMSILPPFNVLHATVIKKGTGTTPETLPQILTDADAKVEYSAASNAIDPRLEPGKATVNKLANGDVYKTNFWDENVYRTGGTTGNSLAFDLYDAFYPAGLLHDSFGYDIPNAGTDQGLPVPDLASNPLEIHQQNMPGYLDPYVNNDAQEFHRFDTTLPFFVNFPFGYTLSDLKWFSADGIPVAPNDEQGRENPYPLVRVQAKAAAGNSLGLATDTVLASVDTVTPISIESDCKRCHTSTADGGNGEAACFAGIDSDCLADGSKSTRSGTLFNVVSPGDDPDFLTNNSLISSEWAADMNIIRLHDAKHGTELENNTPIACQSCHYTPALDLLQQGPVEDGRLTQSTHKSFSNVMHQFHSQYTDLFPIMPDPGSVPTADRLDVLDQTCYSCHPGSRTKCLRGAMFQGDILCQDCHGNMAQVGNDFTDDLPSGGGFALTKRVPWANEPKCQSCHVGDATNQPADTSGFIYAADGIRLLRAWRTGDTNAIPILSSESRFAEDTDATSGNSILYRLSKGGDTVTPVSGSADFKQGHGGVFCEACHGPTHSIWPVTPRSGPFVANDNTTATQLQGHDGKIQECDVCHERDIDGNLTMPLGLDGPHGMHPVNDNRWNHQHRNFTGGQFANCKTCHGADLTGTVLSKTSADRVLDCKDSKGNFPDCAAGSPTANVPPGTEIGCGNCHRQK